MSFPQQLARRARYLTARGCALLTVLTLISPVSSAIEYRFSTIADSLEYGDVISQNPAINNRGSVLFEVDNSEYRGYYLARGGQVEEIIGLTSGVSGLNLTGTQQFNNNDEFVSEARIDGAEQLITWSNGKVTTIYDSRGTVFNTLNNVSGLPAFNDAGRVVFSGSGFRLPDGIYLGNENPPEVLASTNSAFTRLAFPLINNSDTVAYWGVQSGVYEAVFLKLANQAPKVIHFTITPGQAPVFFPSDLSDSGKLIYLAGQVSGPRGIWLYDGTQTRKIADQSNGFTGSFGRPGVNDAGEVVFQQFGDGAETAIFTGANVHTDRLLAVGDLALGGRISWLFFGAQGLNDRGQIAFWAQIDDPVTGEPLRNGIFVATPVPEPSTMILLGLGGAALLPVVRARRRKS